MKRVLILIAMAVAAFGQSPRFTATTGDVALVAAGTKFTIQQPAASTSKTVQLESAIVYCSVACDISQSQNGTAATGTAGTVRALPPQNAASSATVWTASDAGSGTAIGGVLHVPAATTVVLDLSKMALARGGTGVNYSVSIASLSGTVNVTLIWSEQQ